MIIPSVLLAYSCHKSSDTEEEVEEASSKVKVYYSYNDIEQALLTDKDTITVNLTDTFILNVDIADDYQVMEYFIGDTKPFDFAEQDNYQYRFTTTESGVLPLSVFVYFGSDVDDYYVTTFYINVPTINYTIFALENPTYTIDVENDELKNNIQADLESGYFLKMWPLKLECNTTTGGNYQLKLQSETNYSNGTFTTSDASDMTDFEFTYNNQVFSYELSQDYEEDSRFYQYNQDLTEEFKAKYPEESINEVSLTFKGIRSKD